MNPTRIDLAIHDVQRALLASRVQAAALFGSAARNEAGESSDIDLGGQVHDEAGLSLRAADPHVGNGRQVRYGIGQRFGRDCATLGS